MNSKAMWNGTLARLGVKPVPLAVGFEITHLCNLACGYCDRHTRLPNEMSLEQILTALSEFCELGMVHMSLDGGEPLTHRHVGTVVDFLRERSVRVFMNSNGKLIPRNLEIIRKIEKVKISLDGPPHTHDAMRGANTFDRALAGARAARDVGVEVAFTCVVGTHNAHTLEPLIELVEEEGLQIIFQPARPSLFIGGNRRDAAWVLEGKAVRDAFELIARRKRGSTAIANGWASLRHFRAFPDDQRLPCAAGWINVTMDPEGTLYHCGQVSRLNKRHNVVRVGVRAAFEGLNRRGCAQCWCARVVEENYAWGGRVDKMVPIWKVKRRDRSEMG